MINPHDFPEIMQAHGYDINSSDIRIDSMLDVMHQMAKRIEELEKLTSNRELIHVYGLAIPNEL